ncbi:MAG: dicarboxylate/amino acid:cation symporter [Candidatus Porifericomitaceae bacterium WSBS_2022_MAG_OTU9]
MNPLHSKWLLRTTLLAIVAGIFCGWFFGPQMLAVKWLGNMFLTALKMIVVPLLITSVITGITGLQKGGQLGRTTALAVLYYACTTGIAVLIGLLLVNIIAPGSGITPPDVMAEATMPENDGFTGILTQMVHPSLFQAAAENKLLPVILFSIAVGVALLRLGRDGEAAAQVINSLNSAMLQIVQWLMYLMPIGLFALISARLGEAGGGVGIMAELSALAKYMATVTVGLAIHFIFLLMLLKFITGYGLGYLRCLGTALANAFGTASSAATLPLTMRGTIEAGVDPRACRFVVPLGATLNMDGTALYEAVAAIFIAQAYGIELSLVQQVVVLITATLAAVGAAGIPQAGLVTMVIVLTAVNLPLEGIGMLLAVDWILDRFRTTVNVWGDAVGTAIVGKFLAGNNADSKASHNPTQGTAQNGTNKSHRQST